MTEKIISKLTTELNYKINDQNLKKYKTSILSLNKYSEKLALKNLDKDRDMAKHAMTLKKQHLDQQFKAQQLLEKHKLTMQKQADTQAFQLKKRNEGWERQDANKRAREELKQQTKLKKAQELRHKNNLKFLKRTGLAALGLAATLGVLSKKQAMASMEAGKMASQYFIAKHDAEALANLQKSHGFDAKTQLASKDFLLSLQSRLQRGELDDKLIQNLSNAGLGDLSAMLLNLASSKQVIDDALVNDMSEKIFAMANQYIQDNDLAKAQSIKELLPALFATGAQRNEFKKLNQSDPEEMQNRALRLKYGLSTDNLSMQLTEQELKHIENIDRNTSKANQLYADIKNVLAGLGTRAINNVLSNERGNALKRLEESNGLVQQLTNFFKRKASNEQSFDKESMSINNNIKMHSNITVNTSMENIVKSVTEEVENKLKSQLIDWDESQGYNV